MLAGRAGVAARSAEAAAGTRALPCASVSGRVAVPGTDTDEGLSLHIKQRRWISCHDVKKRRKTMNSRNEPQRNSNRGEKTTEGARVLGKILGKKDLQVPHNQAVG